jgi:cytochrome c oxidase subunit 3
MSATAHGTTPYYYVPASPRHPVMAAIGLFFVILGAGQWINGHDWGKYSLALAWCGGCLCCTSGSGCRPRKRRRPVRLQDRPVLPLEHELVHLLGGDVLRRLLHRPVVGARALGACMGSLENALLWPDFKAVWPSVAAGATASPAGIVEPFQTVGPFWLPTINTALLLTSGVTLTIAHHALRENQRGKTIAFMWITVLLG